MTKLLRISKDRSLPLDTVTSTMVVYGGKGMGKTNFGAVLVEELQRCNQRFSFLDPVGVAWGLQHSADGKGPGLEVLILGGAHGDIPIEPTGGAVVADLVADEDVDTVVDISRRPNGSMWSVGERIRFVADYCLRLYERQGERRRPLMQIIDEAGRYVPQTIPHGSPEIAKCVGAIEQLVELGRNAAVGVVLLTQRSARMNKSVSELADCMVAFRTVGPRSVDAIMDWLDDNVEKGHWQELKQKVRSLPIGSALVVSPGWLEFEGVLRMRARETFDSSKTPTGHGERKASGKASKPDLTKYRERMAATIENAKKNDTKLLQKRVAELEKELTVASRIRAPAQAKAYPQPKRVEIPVLTEKQRKTLERLATLAERLGPELTRAADLTRTVFAKLADAEIARRAPTPLTPEQHAEVERRRAGEFVSHADVGKRLGLQPESRSSRIVGGERIKHDRLIHEALEGKADLVRVRNGAPTKKVFEQSAAVRFGTSEGLKKGQREVLTVVAQHVSGVTRTQISIITRHARSTRDRLIYELKALGYIHDYGDHIGATEVGLGALGDFEPLPTGNALREHWLRELPEGNRRVLEFICQHYPQSVEREVISEATGHARSTRDRLIYELAARQLVENVGKKMVRASIELFD